MRRAPGRTRTPAGSSLEMHRSFRTKIGYRIENTDKSANNEFFGTSTSIDFIDFSEGNPFSEGANW